MRLNLRRLRTERKWTIDQLAEVSGLSRGYISQLENERRQPGPDTISLLCDVFGVGAADLIDDGVNPSNAAEPVPLISWVSAGRLTAQDGVSDLDDYPSIFVAGLPRGKWVALRVDGTSMNKISPPDSVIIVNLDDTRLVDGKLYVVADETEGATYKAYDKKADPPFQPRSYVKTDPPEFVGSVRVVGRVHRTMLDL